MHSNKIFIYFYRSKNAFFKSLCLRYTGQFCGKLMAYEHYYSFPLEIFIFLGYLKSMFQINEYRFNILVFSQQKAIQLLQVFLKFPENTFLLSILPSDLWNLINYVRSTLPCYSLFDIKMVWVYYLRLVDTMLMQLLFITSK